MNPLTSSAPATGSAGKLTIVIVDPRPQSRSILKGSLQSLDIVRAVIERSSTTALAELFGKEPVHLVMLERHLGDQLDALDAVRSLKKLPAAQNTRYVLVDQQVDDAFRQEASKLGVTGFLTKPFDLQTLEQVLREGLGTKGPPPKPDAAPAGQAGGKEAAPRVPKDVLDRLRRIEVFAAFSDAELVRLLKICKFHRFPAGEYIFRQGDKGDRLYVLISGQVEIRLEGPEGRVLDTLKPGDCFGEMAIIDSGPRSAHAIAASDSTVIEIMEETVNRDEDLIALKMARQLAKLLTHRIRNLLSGK